MNDAYQQMSEMLDKWLSDNEKEIKIALIEKEILLEKIRNLYVCVSAIETEEYSAPQQETAKPETTTEPEPAADRTEATPHTGDDPVVFAAIGLLALSAAALALSRKKEARHAS